MTKNGRIGGTIQKLFEHLQLSHKVATLSYSWCKGNAYFETINEKLRVSSTAHEII